MRHRCVFYLFIILLGSSYLEDNSHLELLYIQAASASIIAGFSMRSKTGNLHLRSGITILEKFTAPVCFLFIYNFRFKLFKRQLTSGTIHPGCVGFDNCLLFDEAQDLKPAFSMWNNNSGIK